MGTPTNGLEGRPASGPSDRSARWGCGASTESKKFVAIGHRVAGAPGDKFRSPYSGGAAITPGPISSPSVRVARSRPRPCVRHLSQRQEGEAICIGLSEALGLRGVPQSISAAFGLVPRNHGQQEKEHD